MNALACERVHGLWDELATFPAAKIDESCRHLLRTVSGWIGASHAGWIGTVRFLSGPAAERDALSGWRTRTILLLDPPDKQEAALVQAVIGERTGQPGMTAMATAKLAGTFRVHRLRDGFVDLKAFRRTLHYQAFYQALGINDRLWVGSPVSIDAESFFIFDRRHLPSRFAAAHAELAGYTMRGLTWFQRRLLCSHGLLMAQSPLTPTQRQVVQLLLTDKSEKEIAAALGRSLHTTHGHVKQIYRKYNVTGRAGLMAIWLSHR